MSMRDCISDMAAKIGTCVLEALGETATYSSRGGAGVSIYGSPSRRTVRRDTIDNIDIEAITLDYTVTKQPNFPPDEEDEGGGITIDDTVTLNSVIYYIRDFTQDATKTSYILSLENEEARRLRG